MKAGALCWRDWSGRGYADAAQWVYGQALAPGGWTDGTLLTLAHTMDDHNAAKTDAGLCGNGAEQ